MSQPYLVLAILVVRGAIRRCDADRVSSKALLNLPDAFFLRADERERCRLFLMNPTTPIFGAFHTRKRIRI